ncbi:MAG: bifunctional ornithine acetyltransferase/N-acetylglutamate synthase, partial [Actinobacteria bacterium]
MSLADTYPFAVAEGGVVAAGGFSAAGVSCGLKAGGKLDLAIVASDKPVPAAAVFTTNTVAAAPVIVSREHVGDGFAQAVVINAGNANACTGAPGLDAAREMARLAAEALGCERSDVVVCSTGVIGVPLPIEKVAEGIPAAVEALDSRSGDDAAAAIMTTDTFPKVSAVSFELDGRHYTVGGM